MGSYMLVLLKVGAYVKSGKGRYSYQHLFLKFSKFARQTFSWKSQFEKISMTMSWHNTARHNFITDRQIIYRNYLYRKVEP